jgi:hypothetical protein
MKLLLSLFLVPSLCQCAVLHRSAAMDFQTPLSANIAGALLSFTNKLSLSVWVIFTTQDIGGAPQMIFSKGRQDFGGQNQFEFYTTGTDKLIFTYANPDATFIQWTSTAAHISSNSPMHLAVTFNYGNGGSMAIYKNGQSVAGSWTAGSGNQAGLTNILGFHIGGSTTPGRFLNASTCEASIWNSFLTPIQVKILSGSRIKGIPKQIDPEHLRSYWPSDDLRANGPLGTGFSRNREFGFTYAFPQPRFNMTDEGGIFIGEKIVSYQPNE